MKEQTNKLIGYLIFCDNFSILIVRGVLFSGFLIVDFKITQNITDDSLQKTQLFSFQFYTKKYKLTLLIK